MFAGPLVALAALFACFLQFGIGIGVTLLTRPRFPRGGYFLGFLVPLIFPVILAFLYLNFSSSQPCTAENRIGCGDADGIVFLLLGGIFLFDMGVSSGIQYVMSRIERKRLGITNEDWKKRDL